MTLIFLRYIPESVRWLLAKRKNRKAGKIVKKAAQVNGAVLSDRLLSAFDDDNTNPRKVSGIQAETLRGTGQTCPFIRAPISCQLLKKAFRTHLRDVISK
jgi:hypothetical protein